MNYCPGFRGFRVRARKRRGPAGIDLSRRRRAIWPARCRRAILSCRSILPCLSHTEQLWRSSPRIGRCHHSSRILMAPCGVLCFFFRDYPLWVKSKQSQRNRLAVLARKLTSAW